MSELQDNPGWYGLIALAVTTVGGILTKVIPPWLKTRKETEQVELASTRDLYAQVHAKEIAIAQLTEQNAQLRDALDRERSAHQITATERDEARMDIITRIDSEAARLRGLLGHVVQETARLQVARTSSKPPSGSTNEKPPQLPSLPSLRPPTPTQRKPS